MRCTVLLSDFSWRVDFQIQDVQFVKPGESVKIAGHLAAYAAPERSADFDGRKERKNRWGHGVSRVGIGRISVKDFCEDGRICLNSGQKKLLSEKERFRRES